MDNSGGEYKFINLKIGRLIERRNFTRLPMTQEVIYRVLALGHRQRGAAELNSKLEVVKLIIL